MVSVHLPPKPETHSPIIIFFRPGISTDRAIHHYARQLAISANATAVDLHYAAPEMHSYPRLIHTVRGLQGVV